MGLASSQALASDTTATISIAALNGTQAVPMTGRAGCSITVTAMGHASNVLQVQVTVDGSNWININCLNISNNITTPTITAVGSYSVDLQGGITQVRVKMTSYTSGTLAGIMVATASGGNNADIRSFLSVLSVLNSTTAQLAAGATFTGTWEADLTWQGASLSIFADQNLVITFQQSNDGVTVHNSDVSQYTAGSTAYDSSRLYNLVNNYHRVVIYNAGSGTTTTLFANCYPTPNWTPVSGRALDLYGNQRVSLGQDKYGFTPVSTITEELRTVNPTKLIGSTFSGSTIDSKFWATSVSVGTVTQAGSEITLTSGTASPNFARLYSVQRARFMAGSTNKYRNIVQLGDTGTTNVTRKWGVAWGASMPTITDGAYFKLSGTTFSVCTLVGSVETAVASGSFNGYSTTYAPTTSATTYEIIYSNGSVYFIINGQLLHKVTASAAIWANSLELHIYSDVVNSGASAAVTIKFRVISVYRQGQEASTPIYYNITGNAATHTLKLGAGTLHNIIFNNTSGTTITIYDNTTAAAPIIGLITTTAAALGGWDYHIPFFNGLVIVTTGNGLDATVVYE